MQPLMTKHELAPLRLSSPKSSEVELAWAAGFFDGEGCICLHKQQPLKSGRIKLALRVSVSQLDPRPLEKFHRIVGFLGYIYRPASEAKAKACQWNASTNQAYRVLSLLWPYLNEPKKEQAHQVLLAVKESGGRKFRLLE